jgi:glycosyltransferase involved in cell wall biosynthesis
MLNLAEGFRDRGFEVDLVTGNAKGALRAAVPRGVNVRDLGASRVIRALPGLVKYLRNRRPWALISAEDHSNLVALWAKWFAGVHETRVAVTGHVLFSRRLGASIFNRGYWVLWGVKRFYAWADCVATVSAGLADDMSTALNYPRQRITVLYNPVVTPTMLERAKGPSPHPWFRDGNGPVIIGCGRLSNAKNFEMLVQTIARTPNVRCLVIGEGQRRPKLEALIGELGVHDRFQLLGFRSNPYTYMAHADAFVLPSKFEGLPTALIEALALGCPVVATDCPHGPREILLGGKLGPLVPVDDVAALSDAIRSVLRSPVRREALKARAADFHVDRVVEAYISALNAR